MTLLRDYVLLTKPRITALVTLTGAVGFYMASTGGMNAALFVHTIVGVALVAGAANGLNQLLERFPDAKMKRTANRPLPTGRLQPNHAATFSGLLGLVGITYCALFINELTALLAFLTFVSYSFVYTPLKRITPLNTLVGAIPGALPPLGGWAAATGALAPGGWVLFGIVALWQIPHFLAVAYIFKQDYGSAGFKMLPVVDITGRQTAAHLLGASLLLLALSVIPTVMGMTGLAYFLAAVVLSLVYVLLSVRLAFQPGLLAARMLFVYSLIYLPALLIVMTADRLPA